MFSLNSLNSVTKIFVITVNRGLNLPPSHLLCKKPGCYHSTSKTHVRDRIFKSGPIHVSVIIRFPEFTKFSESSAPFRKNSNILVVYPKLLHSVGSIYYESTTTTEDSIDLRYYIMVAVHQRVSKYCKR